MRLWVDRADYVPHILATVRAACHRLRHRQSRSRSSPRSSSSACRSRERLARGINIAHLRAAADRDRAGPRPRASRRGAADRPRRGRRLLPDHDRDDRRARARSIRGRSTWCAPMAAAQTRVMRWIRLRAEPAGAPRRLAGRRAERRARRHPRRVRQRRALGPRHLSPRLARPRRAGRASGASASSRRPSPASPTPSSRWSAARVTGASRAVTIAAGAVPRRRSRRRQRSRGASLSRSPRCSCPSPSGGCLLLAQRPVADHRQDAGRRLRLSVPLADAAKAQARLLAALRRDAAADPPRHGGRARLRLPPRGRSARSGRRSSAA